MHDIKYYQPTIQPRFINTGRSFYWNRFFQHFPKSCDPMQIFNIAIVKTPKSVVRVSSGLTLQLQIQLNLVLGQNSVPQIDRVVAEISNCHSLFMLRPKQIIDSLSIGVDHCACTLRAQFTEKPALGIESVAMTVTLR